ncbi:hypothetical protein D9M73_252720 [compost metagenome]
MAQVDLVGPCGHRAVEENHFLRQASLLVEAPQVEKQVLGTSDRERRDQHVAAVLVRLFENAGELGQGLVVVAVIAIAISGFEQYHIGS